jgi:triosephosphate isomerase
MRRTLIAGNWKMFKTVRETVAYVAELRNALRGLAHADVVVAPPFTALHAAAEAVRGSEIGVSAQNLHWEREGAFTGEVSAGMIREAGASFVIIGHSERRTLFGETDLTVNKKIAAALGAQLVPIVCVGETLQQRDANQTTAVLDGQVRNGLDGFTADQLSAMVIAYEPVWAIGTGLTATPTDVAEVHGLIRRTLNRLVPDAGAVRILYGVHPGSL